MKKIFILIILAILTINYTNKEDIVEIPSTSIRMRVIAKSNDAKDQENKIKIKSALEKKLYEISSGANSYEEVDNLLSDNISLLDTYIKNVIDDNSINTTFTTNYGYNYFPEKNFKGIVYPAGNYKSYVVTLGEGEGENWWCVLYPPLCLIDEKISDYEYHSLIKDTLNKYN